MNELDEETPHKVIQAVPQRVLPFRIQPEKTPLRVGDAEQIEGAQEELFRLLGLLLYGFECFPAFRHIHEGGIDLERFRHSRPCPRVGADIDPAERLLLRIEDPHENVPHRPARAKRHHGRVFLPGKRKTVLPDRTPAGIHGGASLQLGEGETEDSLGRGIRRHDLSRCILVDHPLIQRVEEIPVPLLALPKRLRNLHGLDSGKGKVHQRGHQIHVVAEHGVQAFRGKTRNGLYRFEVLLFRKSVCGGLSPKKIHVRFLFGEQEFPQKERPQVHLPYDKGNRHIPEAVFAFVFPFHPPIGKRGFREKLFRGGIAAPAPSMRLRIAMMITETRIRSSGRHQDFPIPVEDRHGDPPGVIEGIDHSLQPYDIYQIRESEPLHGTTSPFHRFPLPGRLREPRPPPASSTHRHTCVPGLCTPLAEHTTSPGRRECGGIFENILPR